MTIYKATRTIVTSAETKERTVLFQSLAEAVEAVEHSIRRRTEHCPSWCDRSPLLYGNRGKSRSYYEVYLWVNPEADCERIAIEPIAVHGLEGWSLL
jgi:hypothetical protein